MPVYPSVPASPRAAQGAAIPDELLEAALAVVAGAMSRQPAAVREDDYPDLPALLAPSEVARLLKGASSTGPSRNTVDRMIADGELPSVTLRQGARQRMVRVPKAFVVRMMADLNAGVSIPSLKEYTARWQAAAAQLPATPAPGAA